MLATMICGADRPAEVLEQRLGQDEIQAAGIGGIEALEELVALRVVIAQGSVQVAAEGDLLGDGGGRARRPIDVVSVAWKARWKPVRSGFRSGRSGGSACTSAGPARDWPRPGRD